MYGKFTKCPNFTSCLPEKNIFLDFLGCIWGGQPLAPVSYAHGWASGPPPAKSGPGTEFARTGPGCHYYANSNIVHLSEKCAAGSTVHADRKLKRSVSSLPVIVRVVGRVLLMVCLKDLLLDRHRQLPHTYKLLITGRAQNNLKDISLALDHDGIDVAT